MLSTNCNDALSLAEKHVLARIVAISLFHRAKRFFIKIELPNSRSLTTANIVEVLSLARPLHKRDGLSKAPPLLHYQGDCAFFVNFLINYDKAFSEFLNIRPSKNFLIDMMLILLEWGQYDIFYKIISKGIIKDINEVFCVEFASSPDKECLLHAVIQTLDPSLFFFLLEKGADINIITPHWISPLAYLFAKVSETESMSYMLILRSLVAAKNDPRAVDRDGRFIFWYLLHQNNINTVFDYLSLLGLDINAKTPLGDTVLHYLVDVNKVDDDLSKAMGLGANINEVDAQGNSAVIRAANNTHYRPFPLAFRHEAYVAQCSLTGQTPLMIVIKQMDDCQSGFLVKALLSLGADINAVDREGNSALHYACRYAGKSVLGFLTSKSAYVNQANSKGRTPLHELCSRRNINLNEQYRMIRVLFNQGAYITARDKEGKTPSDCSFNPQLKDLIKVIQGEARNNISHFAWRRRREAVVMWQQTWQNVSEKSVETVENHNSCACIIQ